MSNRAECVHGGHAYAMHGEDCVGIAFTEDVGWWRNSTWFTPDQARRLAALLIEQADHADAVEDE